MVYFIIVTAMQVSILCLLYILVRPLLRKYLSAEARMIVCVMSILIMFMGIFDMPTIGKPLITLPWPAPHIVSPVAALDYVDTAPRWPAVVRDVWMTGMLLYLAIGLFAHIRFRVRVRHASRPAGERAQTIAKKAYVAAQISLLTRRDGREYAEPSQMELHRIGRRKPPRLLVTGAVSSPAVIVISPRRVLLDREDYADAELEAILRHAYAHMSEGSIVRLVTFLGMAVGWFNPLLWFMRREARAMEDLNSFANATRDMSEPEQRADFKRLARLGAGRCEAPGVVHVGGGRLRAMRTELFKMPGRPAIGVGAAVFCFVFFIFLRGCFVQPTDDYRANEQSIVAMLGADEDALKYLDLPFVHLSSILMPFDAEYTLYGAIGADYDTLRDGTVWSVALQYDIAADPASVESGMRALVDDLTARLGAPEEQPPTMGSQEQLSWTAKTKAGDPATITLAKWDEGSYWTHETAGGTLIKLYWNMR